MYVPIKPFVLDLESGEELPHPGTPAWRRSKVTVELRRDIDIEAARLGVTFEEIVVDGRRIHLDDATWEMLRQVFKSLKGKKVVNEEPGPMPDPGELEDDDAS